MFTRTLTSHFARSVVVTSLVASTALSSIALSATAQAQPIGNLQQYTDVMINQVSGNTRSAIVNDARQAVANAAYHFDVNNQPNVRANITMYDLAEVSTTGSLEGISKGIDTAALKQRKETKLHQDRIFVSFSAPRIEE